MEPGTYTNEVLDSHPPMDESYVDVMPSLGVTPNVSPGVYLYESQAANVAVTRFLGTKEEITFNLEQYYRYSDVCSRVARSLWSNHKYNRVYVQYLLGNIDKQAFKESARSFAVHSTVLDEESIREISGMAVQILEEEKLSSDDIALLLNLEVDDVERALQRDTAGEKKIKAE